MILDTDEEYLFQQQPDKKILIIWFFTKTIITGIFVAFISFSILVFSTTLSISAEKNGEDAKLVDDYISKEIPKQQSREGRLKLRFQPAINNWQWISFLTFLSVISMQIYLSYLRKTFQYIVTSKRCVFIGGIFKRIEKTVPFNKVTDIQRSQNILERILGIWNVQIFTPGTASIAIGQKSPRSEINFDALLNSESIIETINKKIK